MYSSNTFSLLTPPSYSWNSRNVWKQPTQQRDPSLEGYDAFIARRRGHGAPLASTSRCNHGWQVSATLFSHAIASGRRQARTASILSAESYSCLAVSTFTCTACYIALITEYKYSKSHFPLSGRARIWWQHYQSKICGPYFLFRKLEPHGRCAVIHISHLVMVPPPLAPRPLPPIVHGIQKGKEKKPGEKGEYERIEAQQPYNTPHACIVFFSLGMHGLAL